MWPATYVECVAGDTHRMLSSCWSTFPTRSFGWPLDGLEDDDDDDDINKVQFEMPVAGLPQHTSFTTGSAMTPRRRLGCAIRIRGHSASGTNTNTNAMSKDECANGEVAVTLFFFKYADTFLN